MGVFNLKFSKVPSEKLLDVKVELIEVLQKIDEYSGGKLWIHRLHSSGNPTSQHYHGRAADGHIEGLSVIDQYVLLERFNPGGLGLYGPDIWTSPGFHFDIREKFPTAKWGCVKEGGKREYVALDEEFFKRVIKLEEELNNGVD